MQSHVSRQITDVGTRAATCLRAWLQETERLEEDLRSKSSQIAGGVRVGFKLEPVAEADSLTVQKELVTSSKGPYSVLGPCSIADDLRHGRVQAQRPSTSGRPSWPLALTL